MAWQLTAAMNKNIRANNYLFWWLQGHKRRDFWKVVPESPY